jgi:alkanesulfonate monooxygenase SsuD/methylene tetrahydromethanopterin reductase-like flavin-dependent oxidoreductase (luciferase family)
MGTSTSIGVMFRREQAPETLVNYARRVEALGFDELWVVEDCFYLGGIAQAATALAVTNQITVGLGIVPAVSRNAAFTAMEFATLARMHPGRFHGGIGHGVAEWMDQIGARPASALAALEETASAVRSLLRGENLNVSGWSVKLRDVQLEDALTHVPPVSLGVRSPKSLAVAGRSADGTIMAENASPAYIIWALAHIEEARRAAGRSDDHRVTVLAHCEVSASDPEGARRGARRAVADTLGGEASIMPAPLPYADELVSMMKKGSDALFQGMADEWLDDLAITGRPEVGAAAITRLAEAGADTVVLVPPADADYDAWLGTVGEELLPLLR